MTLETSVAGVTNQISVKLNKTKLIINKWLKCPPHTHTIVITHTRTALFIFSEDFFHFCAALKKMAKGQRSIANVGWTV